MRLDADEIRAIADALVPALADELERRLCQWPEMAMSVPEAAAYAKVEESAIRNAIAAGRLPCCKIGNAVRIKRSDLFRLGDSK